MKTVAIQPNLKLDQVLYLISLFIHVRHNPEPLSLAEAPGHTSFAGVQKYVYAPDAKKVCRCVSFKLFPPVTTNRLISGLFKITEKCAETSAEEFNSACPLTIQYNFTA